MKNNPYYSPKNCNWYDALSLCEAIKEKMKFKALVNLRIARGGCFVARFLIDIKRIKGIESDCFVEIKIYDNLKYFKKE